MHAIAEKDGNRPAFGELYPYSRDPISAADLELAE
jgi:hypothetical protein